MYCMAMILDDHSSSDETASIELDMSIRANY